MGLGLGGGFARSTQTPLHPCHSAVVLLIAAAGCMRLLRVVVGVVGVGVGVGMSVVVVVELLLVRRRSGCGR